MTLIGGLDRVFYRSVENGIKKQEPRGKTYVVTVSVLKRKDATFVLGSITTTRERPRS